MRRGLVAGAAEPVTADLLRRALAGEDLVLDRECHTLHDLTQIAVALQTGAHLEVRNADLMTPIERASVATAARGHVVFS